MPVAVEAVVGQRDLPTVAAADVVKRSIPEAHSRKIQQQLLQPAAGLLTGVDQLLSAVVVVAVVKEAVAAADGTGAAGSESLIDE